MSRGFPKKILNHEHCRRCPERNIITSVYAGLFLLQGYRVVERSDIEATKNEGVSSLAGAAITSPRKRGLWAAGSVF